VADKDDPFDSTQHTIVKPRPGGRQPGEQTTLRQPIAEPLPEPIPSGQPDAIGVDLPGAGPLLNAAGPLLTLAVQLRNTLSHADPSRLFAYVAQEVRRFEETARARGVRQENVTVARYGLCTFLDECALSTPWGAESSWSAESLLSKFHGERYGGEKFFAALERMLREPAGHIDLIELFDVCLLLGFQGRYRIADRGQAKLADFQAEVSRVLRAQKGEFERELSPHWRGAGAIGVPLARYLPVWVVAAAAAVLLVVLYLALSLSLSGHSDPVYAQLRSVGRDVAQPARATTERWVAPVKTLNLAGFLAPEIAAGLVKVVDAPGKTTITLPGASLFGSGSAALDAKSQPLLKRIAEALNTVAGRVIVAGHTDSDPIPTGLRLKFASNWDLAQKRAEAVATLLATTVTPPTRLTADGRADTEPVAPNTTPENKALNRRVDILLIPEGAGA
jgi:type VI secretion system protein ImpK